MQEFPSKTIHAFSDRDAAENARTMRVSAGERRVLSVAQQAMLRMETTVFSANAKTPAQQNEGELLNQC